MIVQLPALCSKCLLCALENGLTSWHPRTGCQCSVLEGLQQTGRPRPVAFPLSVSPLLAGFPQLFEPGDWPSLVRPGPVPYCRPHWVSRGLRHTSNWPHLPFLRPVGLSTEPLEALAPAAPSEPIFRRSTVFVALHVACLPRSVAWSAVCLLQPSSKSYYCP